MHDAWTQPALTQPALTPVHFSGRAKLFWCHELPHARTHTHPACPPSPRPPNSSNFDFRCLRKWLELLFWIQFNETTLFFFPSSPLNHELVSKNNLLFSPLPVLSKLSSFEPMDGQLRYKIVFLFSFSLFVLSSSAQPSTSISSPSLFQKHRQLFQQSFHTRFFFNELFFALCKKKNSAKLTLTSTQKKIENKKKHPPFPQQHIPKTFQYLFHLGKRRKLLLKFDIK